MLAASPGAADGGNGTAANSTTAAGGSGGGAGVGVSVIVGCSVAGAVVLGAMAVRALHVQARKSGRISHYTSLDSLEAVGGAVSGGGGARPPERGGASRMEVADVELASEMVAEVGVWGHIQVGGGGMGDALCLDRAADHPGYRMGPDDPLSSSRRMGAVDDVELGDASAGRREPFSSGSPEEGCS